MATSTPMSPRTFAQYCSDLVTVTPSGVPPMYADTRVPGVATILAQQAASTWRTIPWNSPTSWNGWVQRPDGIEYPAETSSGGPARYSRIPYEDLPINGRFRDAFWLIPAAIGNGILTESTFASTQHVSPAVSRRVMKGYDRIIKHVTGVRL